jgi:hypothetical protein
MRFEYEENTESARERIRARRSRKYWLYGKSGNAETGKLGNWETGKLGNWETGPNCLIA